MKEEEDPDRDTFIEKYIGPPPFPKGIYAAILTGIFTIGTICTILIISSDRGGDEISITDDAISQSGGEIYYSNALFNDSKARFFERNVPMESINVEKGGCNPVPLVWGTRGDYVAIQLRDIQRGLLYF